MTTLATQIDTAIRGAEFRSVLLSAKIESIVVQQYVVELVLQALLDSKSEAKQENEVVGGLEVSVWLDERPESPLTRALGSAIQEDLTIWRESIMTALDGLPGITDIKVVLDSVNSAQKNRFVVPRIRLVITITL